MRTLCGVLSCGKRHGGIEYCYLCPEYPCKRYEGAQCRDSFITHRNMRQDFERAREGGLETYQAQLEEKMAILRNLLAYYNDGRRKSFYCLSVNLLELEDVRQVMEQIRQQVSIDAPDKERAAQVVVLFRAMAKQRGVELVLNRKKPVV